MGFRIQAGRGARCAAWVVACCWVVVSRSAMGQILYVDDDAPSGGNGQTWATAYQYLQDAIATAAADGSIHEIRMAGGNYPPDRDEAGHVAALDRAATFEARSGLSWLGGYRGLSGPGDPDDRDPAQFVSVLNGDLAGNDVGGADHVTHSENSIHVITVGGVDDSCVLDGLTITAGAATGGTTNTKQGGGVYNINGRLRILNCRFVGNLGGTGVGGGGLGNGGGAIYNSGNAHAEIRDCAFVNNVAAGGGTGGAIWNNNGARPLIADCVFEDNQAPNGSAIFNWGATPTVEGSTFRGGSSSATYDFSLSHSTYRRCRFEVNAGGDGGAMLAYNSSPTVIGSIFAGNTALRHGGAIYAGDNCHFTLVNNVFSGNRAGQLGGAIYLGGINATTVTHSTFFGNTCQIVGAAIRADDGATPTVRGSIFRDNTDMEGDGESSQISWLVQAPEVAYSLVQGWTGQLGGTGNFSADPLFLDADGFDNVLGTLDDDLRLEAASPCVNAGDNGSLGSIATDAGGAIRIQQCRADQGAYETSQPSPWVDCNGDGVHDLCNVLDDPAVDCGGNYIPDSCENDCDDDGIADSCSLAGGFDVDCDGNDVPDRCDLSAGAHDDCDANDVPDVCESVVTAFEDSFPDFQLNFDKWSPVSTETTAIDIVSGGYEEWAIARFLNGGRMASRAIDLDTAGAAMLVFRHYTFSSPAGKLQIHFWDGQGWPILPSASVPAGPDLEWQLAVVPVPAFGLRAGARFWIRMQSASRWFIDDVRLTHTRADCNGNGVRDDCDTLHEQPDCNANERPDDCDIAGGESGDLDGFGVPDECQALGDYNGDARVDAADYAWFAACAGFDVPGLSETPVANACLLFFDGNRDGGLGVVDFGFVQIAIEP